MTRPREWCPTCGGPLRATGTGAATTNDCRLCWLDDWNSASVMDVAATTWSLRRKAHIEYRAIERHTLLLLWATHIDEANADPLNQAGTGGPFSQWLPPGTRWGIRSWAPTQDAALDNWLELAWEAA